MLLLSLAIIPVHDHLVTIIPVEPVSGAKPYKTSLVLVNGFYGAV